MNFTELYNIAPQSLKDIIDNTERVYQNPIWHSEGDVRIHTKMVTDRLSKYNDINLSLAGLFHDLGKIDTTIWENDKSTWSSHNHELYSINYIDSYENWILELGGNINIIKDIVSNHMRIKHFDEMKYNKKAKLVSNPNIDYILKFQTADYGGLNENLKDMIDVSIIKEKIKKSKINIIQRFFDKFYISGYFLIEKNNYYIIKTKHPYIFKVKSGILKSNRIKIKI